MNFCSCFGVRDEDMEVFTIFEDDLFSSVNSEVIAFVEAGTCWEEVFFGR